MRPGTPKCQHTQTHAEKTSETETHAKLFEEDIISPLLFLLLNIKKTRAVLLLLEKKSNAVQYVQKERQIVRKLGGKYNTMRLCTHWSGLAAALCWLAAVVCKADFRKTCLETQGFNRNFDPKLS